MKTNRTLADFGELWPAEAKIRDEIDSGNIVVIGEGVPDADAGRERQVRTSFIRYLALGGCDACKTQEKGLWVRGALIFGDGAGEETSGLDLEGCVLTHDLILYQCHFADMVLLRGCSGKTFAFSGSKLLAGLSGDRLEAKGSVFFRKVIAEGEIRLLGAKFGGDLDCQGMDLSNPSGYALLAENLEAKGSFYLRSDAKINGKISLHGAEVGILSDDPDCWPIGKKSIGIDQFYYGAILGPKAPTDAVARLKWLAKIDHMNGFSPQPYEQLAKVLREMGHRSDARDVLIEMERLQRIARRKRDAHRFFSDFYRPRDWILRHTVRYGYQPLIAGWWLLAVWLMGAVIFGIADLSSAMKPNSDRILTSDAWTNCASEEYSQVRCFLRSDDGQSYPAFNPMIYSADTLLPIVDLEMQNSWIPDAKGSWLGILARVYLWFQILAGWGLSLLAVAGFSGLIKKSD